MMARVLRISGIREGKGREGKGRKEKNLTVTNLRLLKSSSRPLKGTVETGRN